MKTNKTISLLKILFIVVVLLGAMQFIFALAPQMTNRVQTSLFALRLPIEITDGALNKSLNWYIFACVIPLYALVLFAIKNLVTLLHPLAEGMTPFTSKSVAAIRNIGFACWMYAIVGTCVQYFGAQILMNSSQYSMPKWNVELSMPVNSIVAGLLVLALAEVFAQGLVLKQDNDSIV